MLMRIAVVITEDGHWKAFGSSRGEDDEMMENATCGVDPGESQMRFWVEVEVEQPNLGAVHLPVSVST